MTGVEINPAVLEINRYLNHYYQTDIDYIKSDVVSWVRKNKNKRFDVVVCLSIIHNIMQAGYKKVALEILYILSTMGRSMIFDIGEECELGDQVSKLNMNLSKQNLHAFIQENTTYNVITLLGKKTDIAIEIYIY